MDMRGLNALSRLRSVYDSVSMLRSRKLSQCERLTLIRHGKSKPETAEPALSR